MRQIGAVFRRRGHSADCFVAFPADDLVHRDAALPGGARIGDDDVVIEVKDHQGNGYIVNDLPLKRNAVGNAVELAPQLQKKQEQVHDTVNCMEITVGKFFRIFYKIQADVSVKGAVHPDAAGKKGANILFAQERRFRSQTGGQDWKYPE